MSGFPPALEPVISNHTGARRIMPQIFDTLVALDHAKNMALRPALAERWERVSDRAVRFYLRKGVTFHDGSPFTADDVAFSLGLDHVLGPGRSGRSIAIQTLETLDRIEVVDSHTVIVHVNGIDTQLEQRLTAWGAEIVSKRAFDAAGSWDKWIAAPVGTGPYKLVSQKLDINVVLAAHDGYWGGKPPFPGIEYKIIPELASRVNGLITDQYDIVTDVAPDQFPDIQGRSNLEVVGGAVQNIRCLAIDQTTPILKDPGLRRALSLAIDRKLLVEALWQNRVPLVNGFQLPSFGEGYVADFEAPGYDPELARKLIKASGYKGEEIVYRLLNNYYTNQVSGAQIMLEMWKAVGLNVKIEMLENFTQVWSKPVHAIYDISSTAVFPDYLGHAWRELGPKGTFPQLGTWSNAEHFALGAKLRDTIEPAERRKIIRRMLDIIHIEDPAVVLLHASGQFYGKRKDVPWMPGLTLDLNFGPFNAAFAKG
ncbi:oligopeptide ABC transporter substrate-binding protein [Bosea caraganae]|uniref:Oligopeptide ABC transporter substrate-binding protein n=2 Tax=Bosea caraganae TaxID=2763117 RepID=A0A370LDD0_9HYPH|nr:oligopeptide ABC transporter substrate-binding protein [Bosea caraganae]RDJ29850.1 oligopeptide ABC transporter substrate-binding protein [Bosea caraganae]